MWVASIALAAVACGGENESADRAGPRDVVEATTFAAELGVDISTFIRTATGLYFKDLEPGTGEPARAGHVVVAHYTGWLADGTEFDSSVEREPLEFPLGVGFVIPGWDEGIDGLRIGGRRRLIVPPDLGYGPRGTGPIPGNAVLVFDVELLDARPAPEERLP